MLVVRPKRSASEATGQGTTTCGPALTGSIGERLEGGRHRGAFRTQLRDRLLQDGLTVGLATPLFHVGQMRLVGLVLRGSRRVLGVLTGGETTTGAVPLIRDLSIVREARNHLCLLAQ